MSNDLRLLRRAAARMRLRAWEKYGDPNDETNANRLVSKAMFETGWVLDDICDQALLAASEPDGSPLPDPLDEVKGG